MFDPPRSQESRSTPRGNFDSSRTGPQRLELREEPDERSIEIQRWLGGTACPIHPRTRRRGLDRTADRGQGGLEIGGALSMRGGQRFEMSRHRLSELPCGRWPTVRTPAIDEGQEQEKDALRVTQATLEGFERRLGDAQSVFLLLLSLVYRWRTHGRPAPAREFGEAVARHLEALAASHRESPADLEASLAAVSRAVESAPPGG